MNPPPTEPYIATASFIDKARPVAIRWIGIVLCIFTLAEVNYPLLAPHSQLAVFALLGLAMLLHLEDG